MTATPLPPDPALPLPPDEKFWQRHSPHHELPFSTAAAVAVHLFVFFLIVLVAGVRGCSAEHMGSVPIEPITIDEGGNNIPGAAPGNRDEGQDKPMIVDRRNQPGAQEVPLPEIPRPVPSAPIDPTPDQRTERPPGPSTVKDLEERISRALGSDRPGQGPRTGEGGGKPGGGAANERAKRMVRWVLQLEYGDAAEYVHQLQLLGAQIGFARPGETDRIDLIRDLGPRPAHPEPAPAAEINRIFWKDNQPRSVLGVCEVLGVPAPNPPHFYAFLPVDLEKELLDKEMSVGRRFGRDTEAKIRETIFAVSFVGNRPILEVIEQTGADGRKTVLKQRTR